MTDLSVDVFHEEFSSRLRRTVRATKKNGLELILDRECVMLDVFVEIYYDTMNKNNAQDYYYFDKQYFETLVRKNFGHVFLMHAKVDEDVVASSLFLDEGGVLYAQFGGTRKGCYIHEGDAAILANCAMEFAALGGYSHLVLGGGVTNDPDDPILSYKKKFSRNYGHDFYVGKRIYDHETYAEICRVVGVDDPGVFSDSFFPAYRKR
jgi:hypothetical protein